MKKNHTVGTACIDTCQTVFYRPDYEICPHCGGPVQRVVVATWIEYVKEKWPFKWGPFSFQTMKVEMEYVRSL